MNQQSTDYLALHEQAQLVNALEELDILKQQNGSAFYHPHHKQDLFHRGGHKKYRYVRTGNRWGKSQCGAAEDVANARGFREWYPEGDVARYAGIPKRSTKGVILVHDWGKAEEIFTNQIDGTGRGKLFDYIPRDELINVHKGSSGNVDCIKIKSKWGGISTIYLDTVKSFLQNPMGHESSQWDWIHVDEPIPQDLWKAVSRGLMDTNGRAWFLCTPLNQAWINDFFIPSRRTRLNTEGSTSFDNKLVIIGSTKDNPHITDEAREEYAKTLSVDERQCRLEGIPKSMSGMVYKSFSPEYSPDGHVYENTPTGWENCVTPPVDYTIRYAIDPHPQTPHAVLFAATAPTGEVFFFREIFEQTLVKNLAEQINNIVANRLVLTCLCDPAAFINNPVSGDTFADTLAIHGIVVQKAVKDLARGIIASQAALKKTMPEGHKWLNFHSSLAETLWEFDHYEWDSKRENKPIDKNDHMMENFYRLILNGLDWVDPISNEDEFFGQTQINGCDLSIPVYTEEAPNINKANMTAEQKYELYLAGY
jgi:hypothetical protein